jgi:hypothetical protein
LDFPTSGSPPAQAHFLQGVAALHSFWYPVALEEFHHPNRAQALLGAARAAARCDGRAGAVGAYTQFLQQWQQGDAPLPELREARTYRQQAGAQSTTGSGVGR